MSAAVPGFCWVDLAATDVHDARRFYAGAFGWTFQQQQANGGVFTRCRAAGHDIGSMYQLGRAEREHGVPSHWTPYLRVGQTDAAVQRVIALGGRLVVAPFDVAGVARIALVQDAVGALVGLWQPQAQSARPAAT